MALVVFLHASSAWAAATLMGVVRENQLGGDLVRNVSVSALGANPVVTGADGQFVLHFPQRKPGENVSIGVSRNGWVVVNDIQLNRALPANASQSPLEILIAKAAERETWALQFYRLQGERVVDARYKKELAAAGLEERARLLREHDQARAQADELARQLATRPAGSGGEDYQKAASLFLDGKINKALEILSEERLKQQGADAKKLHEDTMRSWLLRGQLLAVKFDFDGATRAYDEAVAFAPSSYEAWFAYSFFHQRQNHFKESHWGYKEALSLARASGKKEVVARALNNLGNLHGDEKRMAEARKAYKEALKIRCALAQQNSNVYLPDLAVTLNNLGVLHRDENRMAEARGVFKEALKIQRDLAQQNPDVYLPAVATTLNNLGLLHYAENRMAEARDVFKEALKIQRDLAQQNPDVYLPAVATTLNNLGLLHYAENRMAEARKAYKEALKIYRTFAQVAPAAYEPDVRRVQTNLDALP
ncbi:tetratricopeptide repeat protein [Nitrosomonas mobilis]|uniref:tetratricopeptide repeat protein n=1 Tax=Nitrosomonas mobilis TaxID=51642 RepID=UPI0015A20567|nr:tetratricopeptide repeat protein [Nitrosomonas mobilis]